MTIRVAHVALWTPDIDRLCAFWTLAFGAEVGPLYQSRNRPGYLSRFLRFGDGAEIEVMSGPWVGPAFVAEAQGYAHVALSLGSKAAVDALAERMRPHGALKAAPRSTGDGFYEAILCDPDGNLIEITA
ncbi:VOC family protein [Tabrizicola oligotrophica]|uniref:VOC family protein n=1 Tax=Tabrizicola oligotrophica TaxID=2710650 RepID=UPI001D116050|nr:VOC family protein [Tabrizicola oligotrophica]